jgi:hypothetical protein
MTIDEHEARAIARRWGKAVGSQPLQDFAESGLVADRKRMKEAIDGLRMFLKHPEELDRLQSYIDKPAPPEIAARAQGWSVDDGRISHVHDYDRRISYRGWRECCEGEDIPVEE